ncbi:hypothetical protein F3Y22_tig00112114pilonHSYRG00055 [Hibiscus syriacus]|uniref:Uncharacterized protein n=1 Tax=Hibiscus syriacus TaxID=106335 RepID=A0A6A2YDW9_HIBSY|nr:hypothetical protein F3Y22_tig00112114pilonHSYRG00055 [Hibiscus syriacus]
MVGSKKFKRLKKDRRDFDEDQFGLSDDEFDGSMKGGATAEEKLKRTLFGDDDGQPLEDIAEDEEPIEEEEDGDMGEEDEMADFIVEEDEEHGVSVREPNGQQCQRPAEIPGTDPSRDDRPQQPRSRDRRDSQRPVGVIKTHGRRGTGDPGASSITENEPIIHRQKTTTETEQTEQQQYIIERTREKTVPTTPNTVETEQRESITKTTGLDSSEQNEGKLEHQFEPTVLSEKLTEQDDHIRMTDIPERMQLCSDDLSDSAESLFESILKDLKGAESERELEPKSFLSNLFDLQVNHAVLSTSPTPDGKIAIDSFHQFSGVKWLREKPLIRFDDGQWLLIQKAEEEKLLQVTIKLPEKYLNKLIQECNENFLSNGVSKSAQQWNEQRKLILHDALLVFFCPQWRKKQGPY